MALIGDGAQMVTAWTRGRSQESEHQVRRAVALPLCVFHIRKHDVYAVDSGGVSGIQASGRERAVDRRCVRLRKRMRRVWLMSDGPRAGAWCYADDLGSALTVFLDLFVSA